MKKWLSNIFLFFSITAIAQTPVLSSDSSHPFKIHDHRKWIASGISVVGFGGSFILLNKVWYKDYPRSAFHTFNDAGEWQQMDKIGHAWTAYNIGRGTAGMWKWAGVNDKNAVLLGSGSALAYMLSIEYLDGRSAEWGWSWADAGADIFGSFLFTGQELGWKEQRIQLKFSSHRKKYQPASLEQRADFLFGKSLPERLLKDYNAQTYWLSFNIHSFIKNSSWPTWLNLSFGYSGEGMFGGYENFSQDKNGNITFDRRDIKRYRQWYFAPDIDLGKIKTRSRFLKTSFSILNSLKFPTPALQFSNSRFRLRGLVF